MKILLLASLLTLASCATSYQKMGLSGGYEEQQLANDIYKVEFSGNGYTGSSTVEKYLMRRCAELTVEKGFSHFLIVSGKDTTSESTHTNYQTTYNYGYAYGTANTYTVSKPGSEAVIKLLNNPPQNIFAYDANIILGPYRSTASESK